MVVVPAGQPSRKDGRQLSREVVVRAALVYIDRFGSPRLTMRALGAELGVKAMSLYRYVASRQDLLEAVGALLMGQLRDEMAEVQGRSWQHYLHTLAAAVRRIAVEHPQVFPLIAAPYPGAPWLRPPLPSPGMAEDLLTMLADHGFSDEMAVAAYRTFSNFLLGQLIIEASARNAHTTNARTTNARTTNGRTSADAQSSTSDATLTTRTGHITTADWPTLERMRCLLDADRTPEEFERSLTALLKTCHPERPTDRAAHC